MTGLGVSEFMNYENIILEKKNSIAYVTVNRPKVLNALNMATMEELRSAFHDIKNDAAIRVVIFTGSGEKAFIAGADIGELSKHDAVSGKEYTHRGQNVLNLIENHGKARHCLHQWISPWAADAKLQWHALCGWPARMRSWGSRR